MHAWCNTWLYSLILWMLLLCFAAGCGQHCAPKNEIFIVLSQADPVPIAFCATFLYLIQTICVLLWCHQRYQTFYPTLLALSWCHTSNVIQCTNTFWHEMCMKDHNQFCLSVLLTWEPHLHLVVSMFFSLCCCFQGLNHLARLHRLCTMRVLLVCLDLTDLKLPCL